MFHLICINHLKFSFVVEFGGRLLISAEEVVDQSARTGITTERTRHRISCENIQCQTRHFCFSTKQCACSPSRSIMQSDVGDEKKTNTVHQTNTTQTRIQKKWCYVVRSFARRLQSLRRVFFVCAHLCSLCVCAETLLALCIKSCVCLQNTTTRMSIMANIVYVQKKKHSTSLHRTAPHDVTT